MAISEDNALPPEVFANRTVFIGLNLKSRIGPSQREAFGTPFDANTYGTEIHATAASNLIKNEWIRRLAVEREFALQGIVCAIFTFIILAFSGATLLVTLPLAVLITGGLQYWFFISFLWLPVTCAVGCGVFFGLLSRIMLGNPIYGGVRRR